MHDGKLTGAPKVYSDSFKHGRYAAEAIPDLHQFSGLPREMLILLK